MAELFAKSYASARQAAAFAGLVPVSGESGTLRGHARLSKIGTSRLRKALYLPALTALRVNPTIQAMRGRLQGGRQAANGDRRGRHAEADPPRLRRAQVWSRFRTCRCPPLTANTVSTVVAVPRLAGLQGYPRWSLMGTRYRAQRRPLEHRRCSSDQRCGSSMSRCLNFGFANRWSARPAPTGCQVGRQPNEGHPMPTGLEAWARCPASTSMT